MERVITGLEQLVVTPPREINKARLGLLANQASVGPGYVHAVKLIDRALPGQLTTLFGPQHGYAGEKQDNMIESDHGSESRTDRPIYSLYGETRRPFPEMFENIDVLLIDMVDVGTRVYTFAQTISYCLEEAAKTGKKVLVLDRPNPIGGTGVEGPLLNPEWASFVGRFPVPMRHGLTLGEYALLMTGALKDKPDVGIMAMRGWRRGIYYPQTGLPWVMPSPNMPTPETAWVYPGQVIFEGTNISEGRGTTRPFNLCGAPFIDGKELLDELSGADLFGVYLRPAAFEPTFHKYQGQVCGGLEIHPHDPKRFRPLRTSLAILAAIMKCYPSHFFWKQPPYEYENDRMPIDLIFGDATIRKALEKGDTADEIARDWEEAENGFMESRERYLLYGE